MLTTGSFITGTVKVYSTLIMLSFPTIEKCTQIHNKVHGIANEFDSITNLMKDYIKENKEK